MNSWIKDHENGTLLFIYARPGASKNKICGEHGDRLKIQIAAIAENGKANDELISYLSDVLKISKSKIHLKRGESSKQKDFFIELSLQKTIEIISKYL